MKRISLILFACLAALSASAITLNGVEYSLDTLANYKVGPGSEYLSIRMKRLSDNSGRIDAFLLKVDLKNPYITVEQVLGRDAVIGTETITSMVRRKTTGTRVFFGGTNGDFFATSGDVGRPTGTTVMNSEFVYTPNNNRLMGGVTDGRLAVIGTSMNYSGSIIMPDTAYTINHVNYTRKDNQLVLYNQHNGATTLTNSYGYEVAVALVPGYSWNTNTTVRTVVKAVEEGIGSMAITPGEAVLSAHGTAIPAISSLQVGDTVTISLCLTVDGVATQVANAIAGDNYALIVHDGQVEQTNFWNELHPRTGFGATQQGDTAIFCVVDGRAISVGCTTKVLGEIMKFNGAYNAVNWDGGGSSHLYVKEFGLMNAGCETSERAVGNGMFAVANVPGEDNTIAEISSYDATLRMPLYGVFSPRFLGYNQYGVLISTDVQGVGIAPENPEMGYINADGAFVCLGSGNLIATYGSVQTRIPVTLVDDAPISIRLDSVLISDDTYYAVEVQATVGNNTITLQPSALTWTVDDADVASISTQGILHGEANGRTVLRGQLGDFTDTLIVDVEIPETKPLLWSNMSEAATDWTMKPSASSWNTALTAIDDTTTGLYINFNGGRQANIKFTAGKKLYSVPTFFELRLTPCGFPLNRLIIGLRANNNTETPSFNLQEFDLNGTNRVIVKIDSLLEADGDIAIYPVVLEYMTMYLNTAAANAEYTMKIEGIYLHYGATPDEETAVFLPSADLPDAFILRRDGQIVIRKGDRTYDLQGRQID